MPDSVVPRTASLFTPFTVWNHSYLVCMSDNLSDALCGMIIEEERTIDIWFYESWLHLFTYLS